MDIGGFFKYYFASLNCYNSIIALEKALKKEIFKPEDLVSYEQAKSWLVEDILMLACYAMGADGKILQPEVKSFNDTYKEIGLQINPSKVHELCAEARKKLSGNFLPASLLIVTYNAKHFIDNANPSDRERVIKEQFNALEITLRTHMEIFFTMAKADNDFSKKYELPLITEYLQKCGESIDARLGMNFRVSGDTVRYLCDMVNSAV